MPVKPVLLFAVGNMSRGDDALGPLFLENIQQQGITHLGSHPLKFLHDFQIQIEHVLDLENCERVLLIDADCSLDRIFRFYRVSSIHETLYTTHGMSPSTLLHTFERVFNKKAPLTSMLAIQGLSFELGESLSRSAQKNLQHANKFVSSLLLAHDFRLWDKHLKSECY